MSLGGPASGAKADSSSTPTGTEMSKRFRNYPNNLLYSGFFYGSSPESGTLTNTEGYYLSSTVAGEYDSFYFNLDNNLVYPGNFNDTMKQGATIRCIMLGS